ncbi:aspartic peptidase domain-containing protein [Suillus spraguei]|nr:aspartic peptidase domain-containing protein [Suillus spraguei]
MFLAASLLTISLALSITGSPVEVRNSPITLRVPLTRRLNFSNGTVNFLQRDKARVAAFRGYDTHGRHAGSIPVTTSYLDYTVAVGIGNPPPPTHTHNLQLGCRQRQLDHIRTGWPVNEKYGSEHDGTRSSFSGIIYRDTVSLGVGLTVTNFQLIIASISSGFDESKDNILCIGPRDLSLNTMPLALDDTIPTFTDYLYDQGEIGRHVVGIFFQPVTAEPDSEFGELTFGGTDSTNHGNVAYTPITATPPSSRYWGINLSITYGSTEILSFTAGVVDTGTTFLNLASDAYTKYKALTGGILDRSTGLLSITTDQYSALDDLEFHIGGQIFSLTPDAQIWPRSLNTMLPGGEVGVMYLIVNDIGTPSGQGHDFILG